MQPWPEGLLASQLSETQDREPRLRSTRFLLFLAAHLGRSPSFTLSPGAECVLKRERSCPELPWLSPGPECSPRAVLVVHFLASPKYFLSGTSDHPSELLHPRPF